MTDMTWHTDATTLASYLDGGLSEAYACSVEAHLLACERCRLALAVTSTDRDSAGATHPAHESMHERTWARVLDEVDRPSSDPILRLLVRWWPEHELRPVLAAPVLRKAGCAAGVVLLAIATLVANLRPGVGLTLFLVVAPIVPLIGVSLAYSHPDELCGEIADALPYRRFRLLLARTAAVVGLTIPVMVLLSIALPGDLPTALLWLAPSLAMCSLALALSSLLDTRIVAAGLVVLWLIATTGTWQAASTRLSVDQLLDRSYVFDPRGQLLLLCVAAVSLAVAVMRRSAYAVRGAA